MSLRRDAANSQQKANGLAGIPKFTPDLRTAHEDLAAGDAAARNDEWATATEKLRAAKNKYEEVFEAAKKEVPALLALAKEQLGKKDYGAALSSLAMIEQMEPENAEALTLKPQIEKDRDYDAAMVEVQQALTGEAKDTDGHYTSLSEAKRTKVEAALKRATALKPSAEAKAISDSLGWPLWDGKESVADYAQRAGLPATKDIDLSGERLELVLIPAGKFTMGSPANEEGRFNNETQHEVTLSAPFYMGKYDVTQAQWENVMGSNPSSFKDSKSPVESVSWNDAKRFLARTGNGLKLPTEAQWEYACRAGTTTRFYSGNSDADLERAGWYNTGGDTISPHPVGEKQANAFGLYDMHGNVYQWCEDWLGDYESSPKTDPNGPTTGAHRVLRGGSRNYHPADCRSANRCGENPGERFYYVGFRVVVPVVARDEVLNTGTLPVAVPTSHPPSPAKVSHQETRDNVLVLDGTLSTPHNKPLTYQWKQIGGDDLHLSPDRLNKDRVGLLVFVPGDYKFSLIVSDGTNTSQPAILEIKMIDDSAPTQSSDQKKTEGLPEKK